MLLYKAWWWIPDLSRGGFRGPFLSMTEGQYAGRSLWGQAFSIYYPPSPENSTLLDILNIAHWTHGLTTSLRNSKSNRLVNAAAENSPISSSHSYYLLFLITCAWLFIVFSFWAWALKESTVVQKLKCVPLKTFKEDISLPLTVRDGY